MEQIARIILFLEMLLVNLLTTHYCSRKKYSPIKVIAELILFTVLIFLVSFFLRIIFKSEYINGNIIILLGFMFFFPLKHLYNESSDRILAIMFFSWIHTMTVTSFSTEISSLFKFKPHFIIALLIQTIIFSISTPSIIKYVKNKFLYILKNIPKQMNKYLVILSLVEFLTLSIIFLHFSQNTRSYWIVITIILVALTAAVSYHLIYVVVKNFRSINVLKQLVYSDTLTGVKNRLALFDDCKKLIARKKSFTVVYMDLDNFKKINDTYGHSIGDDYLKQFTKATLETLGEKGNIYRMSGDEFICLYKEDKLALFIKTFERKIKKMFDMSIPFLGVSIGYAKFPEDANSLDELIIKADSIMYELKKNDNYRKY